MSPKFAPSPHPNPDRRPHSTQVEMRTLRPNYLPGDLGFDPLGFKPKDEAGLMTMQTKELNNGRLAMLACAGIVAQELVTNQPLF